MFSGIIEEVGVVSDITDLTSSKKISVGCQKVIDGVATGDSISINGVCLTVVDINKTGFRADIVKETLYKTNLDSLEVGSKVNLERSLQYNQRVGGHLVQGHIDTTGKIVDVNKTDEWTEIFIELDEYFKKYCIYKGSISIDGTSLTIADIDKNKIKVALIPHTLEHTISSGYSKGQSVNIETDMNAKYIENFSKEAQ